MLATYNPDSRNMIDRCLFVDYDVDVKKKEYERYIGYFNTPGIKRVTYYWGGNKAIDVQCEEIMSNRNFNYIFVTEHVKEKLPPLVNAIAVDNPKYHFYKLAKHIAIPREDLMASHFPMTHIIMPGTSYSLGCIFKPVCFLTCSLWVC